MFYNKIIFPLLFLFLSFNLCFAFKFLEDTVDVTQSYAKIGMVNDSSHAITIDSIKVILLEGTVSSQIFFYAVDTPKTYPTIAIKESLTNKKDSLFYLGNYSGYNSNNKVKLPANKKGFIYHFEIGTCVGEKPTLYKKNNSPNSKLFDYIIKLIFYTNNNSGDSVILKGIHSACTRIFTVPNSVPYKTSCNIAGCQIVNILGKILNKNAISSAKNGLVIIQNKEIIEKNVLIKK